MRLGRLRKRNKVIREIERRIVPSLALYKSLVRRAKIVLHAAEEGVKVAAT